MKIREIYCEQFAGIRGCKIPFNDGVNVVYGKNESGKSTIANLISRTLFQNVRLDGRRDKKDFIDLYFPADKKGDAVKGDTIDGKITFETEKGSYTLEKEWGADSGCKLKTPDGSTIRDQDTINEVLREALLYGEGVYSDMLFSSQRNTDTSLETILNASKKSDAKQEITDAVSKAFAETDGISIDAIEQAITAKVDEIAGKHWDFDRKAPARKAGRWSTGLGKILETYYALEDAKDELSKIVESEEKVKDATEKYKQAAEAYRLADEECRRFSEYAKTLSALKAQADIIKRLKEDIEKFNEALKKWPEYVTQLKSAKKLQQEKEDRDLLDKYEYAKKIQDEIEKLRAGIATPEPQQEEVNAVREDEEKISALENKLRGMNLSAAINMFGDNEIEIISLLTGEKIDVADGKADIAQAVKITVPGVMEMSLSPANVNVAEIEKEIAQRKDKIAGIFKRYNVESSRELEELLRTIDDIKRNIKAKEERLELILKPMTYDEIRAKAQAITDCVRTKEEIDADILKLCNGADISRFISTTENEIEHYIKEYTSVDTLKTKLDDSKSKLEEKEESVQCTENVPEEYTEISDPEKYLKNLENERDQKLDSRDEASKDKVAAETALKQLEDLQSAQEKKDDAQRVFDEQKALLNHWLNIKRAFDEQKKTVKSNPMKGLAESFTSYLAVITNSQIDSEFPEDGKLDMKIYSGDNLVDYRKLSEGTKETVSLAFRLAVLDHLFPDGGGVIVLDDPFTDMDIERVKQSCALIKKCAQRHQVIIMTCREEYAETLGVEPINI